MRNVNKMTFDICAFGTKWRKRTTVLAGHVDSADVWALHTMRCHGHNDAVLLVQNTCNSLDTTLLIYDHVHTEAERIL